MPAPLIRRATVRAVTASVIGGIVLGLFPPVFGQTHAPVVNRAVPLSFERIVPERVVASRSGPGVRTDRRGWTEPSTVCAAEPFTMVGVTWRQDTDTEVPVRLAWGSRGAMGASMPLVADPGEGPDPGSDEDSGIVGTAPQWVGHAECLRFRLRVAAGDRYRDLRAVLIDTGGSTDGGPMAWAGSALARLWGIAAPSPASAKPAKPLIVTRKQWGADESLRHKYCDGQPDYAPRLKMAHVHHTAGSNTYSADEADEVVRGVYSYHVNSLHWCDIGYNFLIDRFGRIYEGRFGGMAKPVIGGHASGFNTGSSGVAAMGEFTTVVPPVAVRDAYKRLLAWRLDVAHLPPEGETTMVSSGGSTAKYDPGEEVRLRIVSGHRDTSYTACPGGELYKRLGGIRKGASERGGAKIWKPRQTKPLIEPGQKVRWVAELSTVLQWSIEVQTSTGTVVRRFEGAGSKIDRKWFGKAAGVPVPPGTYTVRMEAWSSATDVARPAVFTLQVV
jgi:hypothetical protein